MTNLVDYENNQGCINAKAARLLSDNEKLAEYMENKTDEQKRLARSHLKTVKALRRKKHG